MILSLASMQNISYSEARKSVNLPTRNSPSLRIPDPRFDYINFPNTLNSGINSSPPSFETPNRFSPLFNFGNSNSFSDSSSPPSASFSSAAKKIPYLINSNLTGGPNPRNPSSRVHPQSRPLDIRTTHPRNNNQLSSSSSTPSPSPSLNLRAHYNLLSSPNRSSIR